MATYSCCRFSNTLRSYPSPVRRYIIAGPGVSVAVIYGYGVREGGVGRERGALGYSSGDNHPWELFSDRLRRRSWVCGCVR